MSYSWDNDGNGSGNNDGWWLLVVILLVLVVAAAGVVVVGNITLFEDGSAMLGRFNMGCVIWFWGCA